MTTAHLALAEHQRAINPGAFNSVFNKARQVSYRRRAARQPVKCAREIGHQCRGVKLVMLDDAVQIAVLRIQDLLQPVLQFHMRVTTQLAQHRCAFDGLVGQRVQLAKQRGATDFSHGFGP